MSAAKHRRWFAIRRLGNRRGIPPPPGEVGEQSEPGGVKRNDPQIERPPPDRLSLRSGGRPSPLRGRYSELAAWHVRFPTLQGGASGRGLKISLATLNAADQAGFMAALGDIYEHAPWVAQAAFAQRPFATLPALHEAMMRAVRAAAPDQRLELIKGHPDLAGKAARAGTMTQDSKAEQASAGLDRLSEAQFAQFHQFNDAYRQKFKMPFIICVRRHGRDSILRHFERRLQNATDRRAGSRADGNLPHRGAAPRPARRGRRAAPGARTAVDPRARHPARSTGARRRHRAPGAHGKRRAAPADEHDDQSRRPHRRAA